MKYNFDFLLLEFKDIYYILNKIWEEENLKVVNLNLIKFIPNSFNDSDNLLAAATPSGPLSLEYSPIYIFPFKYVPVATITVFVK